MDDRGSLRAVVRREVARACGCWHSALLFLVLPLASFAVVLAIFGSGVPRDLPVAVVDADRSALSRQVTRMIDATSGMRVAERPVSVAEGEQLALENRVYALIHLPANLERDARRGAAPKVVVQYNAQLLLPASLIRRDLRAAIGTASAGLELRVREGRGEPPRAALAHLEPIRVDTHALFNPQLNYVSFLVAALLPALLQIFIAVGTVHVVGIELKEGTAGEWLRLAGGSPWRAVIGKLLPYTVQFLALSLFMLALIFRPAAVPSRGSAAVILAGTVAFVIAHEAVALLGIAWLANLRLATSAAALYCAPAFAFVGITFPVMAMPPAGRAWSCLLPLTHYLDLLTAQATRGAAARASLPGLAVLAGFTLIALAAAMPRAAWVLRDSRYWGRS